MDTASDAVMQRINRLERSIRLWKIVGVTLAVVSAVFFLFGASSDVEEEIRAKRFLVIDPAGNSVGEFSATDGTPTIRLSDPSGGTRIVLSHGYDTGSGISIWDGKQSRADLSHRLDDSIALDFFDNDGKLRAVISLIGRDGRPELLFHGKDGNTIRKIP